MIPLKQSTAETIMVGPFLDATDGVTEEVGLAGNATEISKDGGAFATGPTLGTHDSEGYYPVSLTTAHTDTVGRLVIKSHDSATHLPVWVECWVYPANVYDSMFGGSDNLEVDVAQWLGTAPLALSSQRVQTSVAAMQSGVLTAAAIAADAITAAKIATDAIGSDELAATALAEIADAVWDEDVVAAHGTADTAGLLLRALGALISQRTNNPTLNALLGVPDAAGDDVPSAVWDESIAEPAQGAPPATPTFAALLAWFWMAFRNEETMTSSEYAVKADDGTTLAKASVSDDGSTTTKAEMVSGP